MSSDFKSQTDPKNVEPTIVEQTTWLANLIQDDLDQESSDQRSSNQESLQPAVFETSSQSVTAQRTRPKDEATEQPVATGLRRLLFLIIASGFFALGVAGAVLPGLPATPFLLLTSYFLLRSSPRLNSKLLQSRFFGPILVDWQKHGGVRPNVKIKAIALMLLTVALSAYLSNYSITLRVISIALAAVGLVVIARLPEAKDRLPEAKENPAAAFHSQDTDNPSN